MKQTQELDRKYICGIQQIGVGVTNFYEGWKWYIPNFGMDIRILKRRPLPNTCFPIPTTSPGNGMPAWP